MKYERKEEKKISLDEIEPPEGWVFKEDWKVDMNRAVDEEGTLTRIDPLLCFNDLYLSPQHLQAGSTQLRQG